MASVEMKIKGLMIDPVTNMPIIILKDDTGESVLPIWVGIFEANAIAMQLEKIVSPRPMTHDLLKNVIETLSSEVNRVEITDLRDNTFFATIHLAGGGNGGLEIDARPSDAMALALRTASPILVHQRVLERSSSADSGDAEETERLRKWLETVDPEELGRYEM